MYCLNTIDYSKQHFQNRQLFRLTVGDQQQQRIFICSSDRTPLRKSDKRKRILSSFLVWTTKRLFCTSETFMKIRSSVKFFFYLLTAEYECVTSHHFVIIKKGPETISFFRSICFTQTSSNICRRWNKLMRSGEMQNSLEFYNAVALLSNDIWLFNFRLHMFKQHTLCQENTSNFFHLNSQVFTW